MNVIATAIVPANPATQAGAAGKSAEISIGGETFDQIIQQLMRFDASPSGQSVENGLAGTAEGLPVSSEGAEELTKGNKNEILTQDYLLAMSVLNAAVPAELTQQSGSGVNGQFMRENGTPNAVLPQMQRVGVPSAFDPSQMANLQTGEKTQANGIENIPTLNNSAVEQSAFAQTLKAAAGGGNTSPEVLVRDLNITDVEVKVDVNAVTTGSMEESTENPADAVLAAGQNDVQPKSAEHRQMTELLGKETSGKADAQTQPITTDQKPQADQRKNGEEQMLKLDEISQVSGVKGKKNTKASPQLSETDGRDELKNNAAAAEKPKVPANTEKPELLKAQMTDGMEKPVASQISSGVLTNLKQGKMTFQMSLKPEGLGEVKVKMVCDGGKITLNIEAGTASTQKLLLGSLHELRTELSAGNYQVEGLNIGSIKPESAAFQGGFTFQGDSGFGSSGEPYQYQKQKQYYPASYSTQQDDAKTIPQMNYYSGRLNYRI